MKDDLSGKGTKCSSLTYCFVQ